ncbi:SusC/RagA family TonB-linked outer membrane protein, partial [Desulfosarcina sp.]|nr:SusC/RagA family TonB-linked outer membrane protein [Desulfosarcina sp.]
RKFTLFLAFFIFTGMQFLHAQDREISGTVISADDNLPIPGVQVLVQGTQLGTTTDLNGKYTIVVPPSATVLVYRFIGMVSTNVEIGAQKVIDVTMKPDILDLEGVVVTALGISREKKALGYAVQDMSGDQLNQSRENNVVNALQGKAAGVQITNSSGGVGSSSRIIIRGNSSFGNNQPLFVVDGVPVINSSSEVSEFGNDEDYGTATSGNDFGNAAMDIDPANVESVSILKGANAAALYGSRAANGVILITTKKGGKLYAGQKGPIGVDFSTGVTFDNIAVLPKYQNEYGQGYHGSKYLYEQYQQDNPGVYANYQEYAQDRAFTYYDGLGNGVQDGRDESWGPKMDDGLNLAQFDSPYTLDGNGDPVYQQTPWVSNPDNTKDFFETGTTWSTNVALTGGTEKASARLSLNNTQQKGAVPNTDLSRNNVALSGTLNLHPKFSGGGSIAYTQNRSDNLPGVGYDANNVMQSIGGWFGRQVDMNKLKDNWETDNAWGNPYNWNTNFHNNPYWTVYKNTTSRRRDRVFGTAWMKYNITDKLSLMGRIGSDWYSENRKHVVADRSNENSLGGEFWESETFEQETNADIILNGANDFNENFGINYTVGANYRNQKRQFMWMRAPALTVPDLYTITNVSGDALNLQDRSEKETNSLYGSVSFAYKRFLYLDVTGRNDWSSTLPKENWSYFYPSVGVSWVFTENFNISENILSFGKIRGSWAKVGNDTDPYQTMGTYSQKDFGGGPISPIFGVAQFHYPYIIPPTGLLPEQTTSIEIGTDLKFLKNRLGVDFTWYDMKTTNQILAVDISYASGFEQMLINAGEIQNTGIELMLYGKALENKDGLNWDIILNWSTNTNKVNELYGDLEAYEIADSWGATTIEARPGEPYGQIKGGAYVRNGNGQYIIDAGSGLPVHASEPQVIGNILPDYLWGIQNIFNYKDFTLSFLFDGRMGGDIFSVTHWFGAYSGVSVETTENGYRENGVSPSNNDILGSGVYGYQYVDDNDNTLIQYTDGDGNDVANPIATDQTVSAQDFFQDYWGLQEPSIIDGTFIKLREVVFGWDMPKKWFDQVSWIQSANFSFVGRNLALLYVDKTNIMRIDPETGFGTTNNGMGLEQYQIPPTRSLGFKLRIIF